MAPFIAKIQFFRDRNLSHASLVDILYRLEIESKHERHELARIGTVGDRFYIILQGTVEIQVPDPKNISLFKSLE